MNTVEIWKSIPGHPGYEASNLGGVRSIDRWVNGGSGRRYFREGSPTHIHMGSSGYLRAAGIGHVHVLVMRAFHGERPKGYDVAHNDGDRLNNVLANLRYATRLENIHDTMKRDMHARGERNGQAKLTEDEVIAIRSMYGAQRAIAARFNVSQILISMIKRRERWGWL